MNYHDVALLNSSLDSLSDSLLRRKMLAEQSSERRAQTGLAQQRLSTDEAFHRSQEAYQGRMETKADQANTLAESRAQAQDKSRTLQTIMQLNAAGQLDNVDDVNSWLQADPHFSAVGIQLKKVEKPIPQAGQNSAAQLAQQRDYWHQQKQHRYDQIAAATTDEQRALAQANYDQAESTFNVLDKVFNNLAEPQIKPAKKTVKVKTGGGLGGAAEVTQEFSPEEYQAYQAANAPAAPMDPKQRVANTPYKLPNGKVGTWTGAGWQLQQ